MSKAAAGIAILASVATVFDVFLAYMGNKQDEEFGRGAIYAKETEIAILKEQRAIMETIAAISVNATQVIGTPEIVVKATSDLSATATVLSEEADKAATRVAEEETRVATNLQANG